MADKIEPALSAEGWEKVRRSRSRITPGGEYEWRSDYGGIIGEIPSTAARIALLKHTLPDSDPRKITREKIEHIRAMSQAMGAEGLIAHSESDPDLDAIADALESYLPPSPEEKRD